MQSVLGKKDLVFQGFAYLIKLYILVFATQALAVLLLLALNPKINHTLLSCVRLEMIKFAYVFKETCCLISKPLFLVQDQVEFINVEDKPQ